MVVALGLVMGLTAACSQDPPKTPEQQAAEAADALAAEQKAHPERQLDLADYSWSKGGFETVMLLSGRIKSTADSAMKDPTIRCTLTAPSGTELSRVEQTLYRTIPGKKTVRFHGLNMGFMGTGQAARASCQIVRAVSLGV